MSEEQKQSELPKSVIGFLDKYGEKLWSGVKFVYKAATDEARMNWRLGYERYLHNAYNKHYFVKTFLSTDDPRPLYDFYVPLGVSCGPTRYDQVSVDELISFNKFAIITATGGSGKTMMMRHLFVDTLEKTHFVPVFVELRELNNKSITLHQLIEKKLKDNDFDFSEEYIEKALEAGHFSLLLDGFDEISDEKREEIIHQIQEIADHYRNNNIILSSRPDDSLYNWQLFSVWQVRPLSLDLAVELIEKTDTEQNIKEKFVNDLKAGLFETHRSFLSNPLLLSIMLITYENTGSIPQKITTFYERAYTALFEQHDARKAYHRVKRTNLDIFEFRKVFAAFCYFSYIKNDFNFSDNRIYQYLEKAKTITGIDFDTKDYLHDAIQAICLLIRDGLDITFTHRSFQEYFASFYNSQLNDLEAQKIFLTRQLNSFSDESIELSFEVSSETIERSLIIPVLEEFAEKINFDGTLNEKQFINTFDSIYHEIGIGSDYDEEADEPLSTFSVCTTVRPGIFYEVFSFVSKHYIDRTDSINYGENGKLFQLVRRQLNERPEIAVEDAFQDKELLTFLMEGQGWLSREWFLRILKIKDLLTEKYRNRSFLLQEEIFGE